MKLDFLNTSAVLAAPRLLGCLLVRELNGQQLVGKIVETEAYDQADAASHSFKGPTPRTEIMFGPSGFAYVYFTYGMHYCFNIVTGPKGHGSAVLIRAVEPMAGQEIMQAHRQGRSGVELTNGPAKLCYALSIDRRLNKHDLSCPPLQLKSVEPVPTIHIVQTTRIGISQATHQPWRWYIKANPYVSRP